MHADAVRRPEANSQGAAPRGWRSAIADRPWWPAARRGLTLLFFAAVAWLLVSHARSIEWSAVWREVRAYPAAVLWAAAGLAASSHAVYCSYDLIGRWHVRHRLPTAPVVGIGLVSYAFNLNLGSLVGGFAVRYRLYARFGLKTETVSELVAMSMLTNWLGYLALGGMVFVWRPLQLPAEWGLARAGVQAVGVLLLLVAATYVFACFKSKRREWLLAGHPVRLPTGRVALVQLGVSSANWLLIAAVVWVLLQARIDYPSVLGAMLIAAIAGVIAHVPAGLGVLEAVVIGLLSSRLPSTELLGALLAYRALYYLAPLCVAAVVFVALEAHGKRAA